MTSQLDDEGLHPMVSTLLSGSLATAPPVKRYNRERMMELRMTKESQTRPETLSEDFNGDDGKFSPFKWLEHRWEIEGIKNRPLSKKIDSLCAGADENTGLSPQRRAFSSGCKAPTDDKGRDGEYERLGGHGKNWRNGSNGGADKFASRGTDFKPAFQKGSQLDRGTRGTDLKKDLGRPNNAKFGQRRDDRLGSVGGSEKLPEWADGPTTMDDMIELRGFDEPKKGKNKKNPKEKKEKEATKPADIPECGGSRPSSTGLLTNNKGNVEQIGDSAIETAEIAYPQSGGALPATDQELAALLGVLDIQKTSRKAGGKDDTWSNKSEEPAGSSRLSRFFGKKSKSPELAAGVGNEENVANPMLAKLFGHGAGDSAPPPSGGMRLEDLEKGIDAKEPTSKVSPLQDPSQQAQLMAHLHKMAKQQAEQQAAMHQHHHHRQTPPNGLPQQQMHHPMVHPNMPIVADPALLASFAQNPIVLNAYVENQLQEAVNAAIRANNGQQIPQQLHEQLRMASIRNKAFLQSQTLTFVSLQQQAQQLQQHHQQHKGRTPAMIPASVQRQLQKNSVVEQKKEKSQSPPESSGQDGEEVSSQMKKLHMQQNYANMMQAMNSGLGWSNRVPNASQQPPQTSQQQQQLPPNVQMLMAQHQQAAQMHHMKMMMGRAQQQQMLMAKLLQMQQAQQQQHQMANMQERHGVNQQPQPVPSELSQVGPIQTPLEKLLASVGVQGSQFTGSGDRIPSSARPMSLEDLEKQLTAAQQK